MGKRVACFSIGRRLARASLFSIERMETPPLERGPSTTLLYLEEADSFSIKRRECLSPYREEYDSFPVYSFSVRRRECLPSLYRGGRLLLYE